MMKNETQPNNTPVKKRNGIISFWKFCFCVMIIMFHSYVFAPGNDSLFFNKGYIAVEFFFIVSGFFLARTALSKEDTDTTHLGKETFHFITKKLKTFLPYAILGGLVALILQHVYKNVTIYKDISSIWDMLLLRMTGIDCNVVIGQAWYISAMLLCMTLLYPILRKYKYNFIYIAAPLIVLLGFGWLSYTYDCINNPEAWTGLLYKGVIRAFIDLTLGSIVYALYEKIKNIDFTNLGRLIITIIEILGFVFTFFMAQFAPSKKYDFILIPILAISILLALSEKTLEYKLFSNKIFFWLEKFSLPLFMFHHIARNIVRDDSIFTSMPYLEKFPIYVILAFVISLIGMWIINFLKSKNFFSNNLKKLMIK